MQRHKLLTSAAGVSDVLLLSQLLASALLHSCTVVAQLCVMTYDCGKAAGHHRVLGLHCGGNAQRSCPRQNVYSLLSRPCCCLSTAVQLELSKDIARQVILACEPQQA